VSRERSTARRPGRAVARLGALGILPHWLERQLDPRSPAFVPRGGEAVPPNLTLRNWTAVGTVASPHKGIVDPRGLLTPWPDGWSLDWWIGAEDRWHFPSREAAVRQQLVNDTPVVETAMRVPGGDAVHRVYAVPSEDGPLAVVEIANTTPTPFAVAFAVRPYHPTGPTLVERFGLDERTVTVDGRVALLLPKRPSRLAASTFADGDVVDVVTSGRAGTELPEDLVCETGGATAAFLFPLAHRATLRIAVPLAPEERPARPGLGRRGGAPARARALPEPVPDSDAAVRSWQSQTSSRGMRLVLPEGRLASAIEANRRYLLLFHEGADMVSGPFTSHDFSFEQAASLLRALDRYGFHREAAEVLSSFRARQRADGFLDDGREVWTTNGAALHAMAEHWRLTGTLEAVDVDAVARAARWIERKRSSSSGRDDAAVRGLLPPRGAAAGPGAAGVTYADAFWSLRGLLDAAVLLAAFGLDDLAAEASGWADGLRRDLDASIASVAARLGHDVLPAGPHRRVDAGIVGTLAACVPLELLPVDHPTVRATLEAVRQRYCVGSAFYDAATHTGLDPSATAVVASVELAAGDPACLERLAWLVEAATTTSTWPSAIHPGLGGGCAGDGHDGAATAGFLSLVRDLLVREVRDGLDLVTALPEGWLGHNLEVHDAPTHFGLLSFAVRWHGDRPALLWDLRRRQGAIGDVRLRAPGLDPAWWTTAAKGETLLAAGTLPPPPEIAPDPDPEGSFS